jgi:hypothetical protein
MIKAQENGIHRLLAYEPSPSKSNNEEADDFKEKDDCLRDYNQNIANANLMDDILEFKRKRSSDASSYVSRVSLEVPALEPMDPRVSTDLNISDCALETDKLLHELSINSDWSESGPSSAAKANDINVNLERLKKRQKPLDLRRFSNVAQLENIEEYGEELGASADSAENQEVSTPNNPEKLERSKNSTNPIYFTPKTSASSFASDKKIESLQRESVGSSRYFSPEIVILDSPDVVPKEDFATVDPIAVPTEPTISLSQFKETLGQEMHELKEKMHLENQEILYQTTGEAVRTRSFVWANINRLEEKIDMLSDSIAMLMQEDPLVGRVLEIQAENEALRKTINELIKRNSN